jgi:deoxyribodipyrimidine photolyase
MDIEKAIDLATDGLLRDGGHHKQWFLEEILKALDVDLDQLRKDLLANDYDWEEGIAP